MSKNTGVTTAFFQASGTSNGHHLLEISSQGQLSIHSSAPSGTSHRLPWTSVYWICLNGPLIQSPFITGNRIHSLRLSLGSGTSASRGQTLPVKNQDKEDADYLSSLCLMHLMSLAAKHLPHCAAGPHCSLIAATMLTEALLVALPRPCLCFEFHPTCTGSILIFLLVCSSMLPSVTCTSFVYLLFLLIKGCQLS